MPQLLKSSVVTAWFQDKFREPTPAQAEAWPRIQAGKNVLIVSPTGTGKTFAAFLAVLNELALLHEEGSLRNTIYALYLSPLRALSYDLEKNLNEPLSQIYGGAPPIRVGLRTGDTTPNERQKQLSKPPHILLTTPESLSLLLTQTKWLPVLGTVRWFMVDEIPALAENKRGAHLSLSLERLDQLVHEAKLSADEPGRDGFHSVPDFSRRGNEGRGGTRPYQLQEGDAQAENPLSSPQTATRLQRIGLSATVASLTEVAQFLVGTSNDCDIVDASTTKKIDLRVYSPLGKDPYPPSGYTGQRLIRELARLIKKNRTTLIFTNTRSGAEAASFWLHQELPELADQIECHHASLDRDVRQEVEDRLKRGELRAVVCSTSLELGIDIGSIDLVVMLSTPKGVSRALQRTGGAGHNIHAISRGLLMATNLNDLVECCATALLARVRRLDAVRFRRAPLDVLAQHLVSMGCIRRWDRTEALHLVRRAYLYRELTEAEFNDVLDYLAGGGKSLRQQYTEVFGKIQLDDNAFETRLGPVRRDLLQNMGVIPNEGVVQVQLKGRTLGMIEETFIRQLQVGDIFVIAGRPVRLERIGIMECFVSRADSDLPTVPRWNANKMPLTNNLAQEIIQFRSQLRERLTKLSSPPQAVNNSLVEWIAERLDCGLANAEIIYKMYAAQYRLSDIPSADFLLVGEYFSGDGEIEGVVGENKPKRRRSRIGRMPSARHYFFHFLVGRAANEALSRVVALRLSRLRGGNAIATPDDYGFVLTVTPAQHFNREELPRLLAADNFRADLEESLSRSELLKYHFRNAAQTGMMVYRNFFGERKSVRKVQWSSEVIFNLLQKYEPDHVLLREARRDTIHTYIDIEGALAYLELMAGKLEYEFSVGQPRKKAPEDWRSPKAGAGSTALDGREASWTAAVFCRFWIGRQDQRSRGHLLPLSQPDDAVERLLELQACYRPREIVLLGDIIHRALSLPQLKSELKELCERLSKQSVLTWMVGNHDRRLDELLAECDLSIQLKKEISVGPHLLVHGDADDPATVRTAFQKVEGSGGRIVMGHEHPAVSVGDGVATSARCPCFLVGDQVLILPAFSPWVAGVLVRNKSFMSGLARKARFTQAIAILGDKLLPLPLPGKASGWERAAL